MHDNYFIVIHFNFDFVPLSEGVVVDIRAHYANDEAGDELSLHEQSGLSHNGGDSGPETAMPQGFDHHFNIDSAVQGSASGLRSIRERDNCRCESVCIDPRLWSIKIEHEAISCVAYSQFCQDTSGLKHTMVSGGRNIDEENRYCRNGLPR